jgi:hypothetical protein
MTTAKELLLAYMDLIRDPDEAFLSGYRDVIWISVGLAAASALSALMLHPKERSIY